jgi:hydrogenase maturation protease
MSEIKILIAGVGNIFLGDDAFGVEVIRRLRGHSFPEGVRVADFGIRGLDLAYTILDGCGTVILVDAVSLGAPPGTLYTIEPEDDRDQLSHDETATLVNAHGMDPASVLRLVRQLGAADAPIYVVGCEPTPLDPAHEMPLDLSAAVAASLDGAVKMIEELVERLLDRSSASSREAAIDNSQGREPLEPISHHTI